MDHWSIENVQDTGDRAILMVQRIRLGVLYNGGGGGLRWGTGRYGGGGAKWQILLDHFSDFI